MAQPQTPQRRHDQGTPVRVYREDRVQMPAHLEPAQRTRQGYLLTHAAIAVPGIMEYEDAAGNVVRELIDEEELHNADSLASLATLPVTLGHPDEDVSPDNVGALGVGHMGPSVEVLQETGHIRVLLVVQRGDALQAIDDGVEEVSPGYTTVIDPTPGVHPIYGRYDARQTQRRYNHVAIIDQARGGPTVRLRTDGARRAVNRLDAPGTPAPTPLPTPGVTMHPFLITLAALCCLPYSTRADGSVHKKDFDGPAEESPKITEDQLISAIADAISQFKAQAEAGAPAQVGEDEMAPEAMKAKILELEGELAALRSEKAATDQVVAEEKEKADRAHLDGLALRVRCDTAAWTDATTASQRQLAIARHKGFVRADEEPAAESLNGMIRALDSLHPSPTAPTADPYTALAASGSGPSRSDGWSGPSGTPQEPVVTDPMKAEVRKRNADRRAAN